MRSNLLSGLGLGLTNLYQYISTGSVPVVHDPSLLLESGDYILLESSDTLLLE